MAEIHVGDIGTAFIITIKNEADAIVDISTAVSKTVYFKKPSTEIISKNAVLTTDGADGKMQVVTTSGDIDQKGRWIGQAKVEFVGGQWYTNNFIFNVEGNIVDGTF